ncbi:uncharacterized protein BO72DRAFT_34486 [Aspergillus fijiensis CBS 313.89]|uniref:Uncharacterized protein n=1 Tax=Aspergillus fijiensis CBS 313.89 TaxID=1448319 RepID=A0A8G1RZL9_9EURO|nr:uncharacterized protein BO72DRAFT_34486 [Aspergillus fijiensis CBS 313.89]RAK79701.1 hypothetical protein BO72DRAFT_34486 [Aspergillus fijiensis CBS 313.89]
MFVSSLGVCMTESHGYAALYLRHVDFTVCVTEPSLFFAVPFMNDVRPKWPRRQAQHSTGSIGIFTHNNSSLNTVWTGRQVKVAGFEKKKKRSQGGGSNDKRLECADPGKIVSLKRHETTLQQYHEPGGKRSCALSCNADAIHARGRIDVGCSRCVGGVLRSGSNANGDSRKNGNRPQWYHSWKCTSVSKVHRCFRTSGSRSPRGGGEVEDTSVRRPRQ